jgi:hypothetical protein
VQRRYIFKEISRQKWDDQGGRVVEEPPGIDVPQAEDHRVAVAAAMKEGVADRQHEWEVFHEKRKNGQVKRDEGGQGVGE